MSLYGFLRGMPARWRWARIAELLAINAYWALRTARHQLDRATGTHTERPVDESVAYIERVFDEYKRYGGISHFYGAAAEIGPGDNAGVALLMRQDGCRRVDLIERFVIHADPEQQAEIYRSLSARHDLDAFRVGDVWNNQSLSGIEWQPAQPAEEYFRQCPSHSYDFIVSRSVLSQVRDPLGLLADMLRCLRPRGHLVHQIDLSDHGLFSRSHDELTWLRFPPWLWRLSSSHSAQPNRVLLHEYREVLEPLKRQGRIEYDFVVSHLVSVGEVTPAGRWEEIPSRAREQSMAHVEQSRHGLAPAFRDVPAGDLAVAAMFLVVTMGDPTEGRGS